MTHEEKELLLRDLCTRLPYGITIYRITDNSIHHIQYSDITENIDQFSHFLEYSGINDIKPYLRPMSSMTEEEQEELYHYYCKEIADNLNTPNLTWELRCCVSNSFGTDWLNAHHFDYRGLIPLGLALPATENMYNF